MSRVLWEGKGDWNGAYVEVLDAPLLPPQDKSCEASVDTADGYWRECGVAAVAWRCDSDDMGDPWPACMEHAS